MPGFKYIAADREGKTVRGQLTAESPDEAGRALENRGLVPLELKGVHASGNNWSSRQKGAKWRIEEKIIFTRKITSLIKAGIPLLSVLHLIARQTKNPRVAGALHQIGDAVANGKSLYDAMSAHPTLFDPLYLGAISTGEATGRLDSVLDHTATFLERTNLTQRRVKEALRYPIMVVIAIFIAGFVVMKFVVPQFLSFYGNNGAELPLPTQVLMMASDLTGRLWWLIFPLFGLLYLGWQWTRTASGRKWRDDMLLRIPILGEMLLKVSVSQFSRLFSVLYSAGVPATSALDTVANGVGNVIVAGEVRAMRERLTAGGAVADPPADAVMPDLVYQMLGIGFESGAVERMLLEVARHYEEEIDYDVRRLTERLQPILLVFIAAGVLFLALAVLLPMWNLISVFQA